MIISSDFKFYYLYGDIYFSMVIAKATRTRMILGKTPLKVYSNLKIQYRNKRKPPEKSNNIDLKISTTLNMRER